MNPSLSDESLSALTDRLRAANEEFTTHYAGETGRRQPLLPYITMRESVRVRIGAADSH